MHVFEKKKLNFHFLNSLFSGIACRRVGVNLCSFRYSSPRTVLLTKLSLSPKERCLHTYNDQAGQVQWSPCNSKAHCNTRWDINVLRGHRENSSAVVWLALVWCGYGLALRHNLPHELVSCLLRSALCPVWTMPIHTGFQFSERIRFLWFQSEIRLCPASAYPDLLSVLGPWIGRLTHLKPSHPQVAEQIDLPTRNRSTRRKHGYMKIDLPIYLKPIHPQETQDRPTCPKPSQLQETEAHT